MDFRSGSRYDIYGQRIDRYGNELWSTGGEAIMTTSGSKQALRAIADGEGGAILVWQDYRSGNNDDIYAARIGPDGSHLWASGGVGVCTSVSFQYNPCLASDGAGGAVFAYEYLYGPSFDIYAQAVDAGGSMKWAADGIVISSASNHQLNPEVATDANGGAVIVWHDARSSSVYDIYAQRVNSGGTVQWAANGVAVCTESEHQIYPKIARTEWGDFIIAWEDERNVALDSDIYAQALSFSGTALWGSGGIPVHTNSGAQAGVSMTSAEGEFVIVAWEDEGKLRIQKLGTASFGEWGVSNVPPIVCSRWLASGEPQVVHDDLGGAFVAWNDDRNGTRDIFAQHVDSDGSFVWAENGIPVATATSTQYKQSACSDGEGGIHVAWSDYRNGNYDIYAQRLERNGYWGYPAPGISSAFDVPSDQGGFVELQWTRSRLDAWPDLMVEQYSVWRAVDAPAALAAAGGAPILATAEALDSGLGGASIRMDILGGEPYFWELVGYQDAYSLETYSGMAGTMYDSTASNEAWHYFQVIAHAEDRTIYWIGEPDSAYSVDNLAPVVPVGLAGEQIYSPEGLQLTWNPNSESDLSGYNIYRGDDSGFLPGPGSFVGSTPDTILFDEGWKWQLGFWYKVAAVDIHGNESVFAILGPDMITGDDPVTVPDATFIAQNFPNPFNPATTIEFGLRESAHVSLRIYDAAGRLVRILIDESRPAGQYASVWNGKDRSGNQVSSGVYFCRLRAGTYEETRKMVMLR
jgi:hypothetical protein